MNFILSREVFLNGLLDATLQAGVLVVLVLVVQTLFRRRLSARWRFALWWIVVLRLVLPVTPQSSFSLFNHFRPTVEVSGPRYFVDPEAARRHFAEHSSPEAASALESGEMIRFPGYVSTITFNPGWVDIERTPALATAPHPPAEGTPTWTGDAPQHLIPRLLLAWGMGAMVILGIGMVQSVQFQSRLRHSRGRRLVEWEELLNRCRADLGVRPEVELAESSAVRSPVICGLFRPRLLLPPGMASSFSGDELRHIFLHELAHVKRRDLWLNWLLAFLLAAHWFNPLIWIGFRRLRADRELACDEIALHHTDDMSGRRYGETIIKLLEGLPRPVSVPGMAGILEDGKQMKRRIRMIAGFGGAPRWSALAALVLVVALGAVTLTDGQVGNLDSALSDRAKRPHELRKLSKAEVIEAALSMPVSSPWAWRELESRPLLDEDVGQIMDGLTAWLEREYPSGYRQPLFWCDNFLRRLDERVSVADEQKVRFLLALHGELRSKPPVPASIGTKGITLSERGNLYGEPSLRMREGNRTLNLKAEYGCRWARSSILGLQLINELIAVTVNGESVDVSHRGTFWDSQDLRATLSLPPLAPGNHTVQVEVLSALVAEEDLVGLQKDAPSREWPPAKKRWKREAEFELVVHPKDAVIVLQTQDPALDPIGSGALSVRPILVRPKGDQAQAVLQFELEDLPLPVSFDVRLLIDGVSFPCGQLWGYRHPDGQRYGGAEMHVDIPRLGSEIREADVILTPNPQAVEHDASVNRIWGGEVVFSEAPLKRLDAHSQTSQ